MGKTFELNSYRSYQLSELASLAAQAGQRTNRLTDLSSSDDVLVFGVLIDSQTEDVVCVLQVETLSSCQDRKQER